MEVLYNWQYCCRSVKYIGKTKLREGNNIFLNIEEVNLVSFVRDLILQLIVNIEHSPDFQFSISIKTEIRIFS